MKKTILGIRIQNAKIKDVYISRFVWKSSKGFKFTSLDDECNFVYIRNNLQDAIEAYEEDTSYQCFTNYRYWTEDEEIKMLFDEIAPF